MFLGATEGDFIDIYVVRGMFCIASEGFYSLFTSFAGVCKGYRKRFYRYLRRSQQEEAEEEEEEEEARLCILEDVK